MKAFFIAPCFRVHPPSLLKGGFLMKADGFLFFLLLAGSLGTMISSDVANGSLEFCFYTPW